jgi:hypothetical protein
MAQYELYRRSTVGIALTDTLDDLIEGGHLDPQVAMRILAQVRERQKERFFFNVDGFLKAG